MSSCFLYETFCDGFSYIFSVSGVKPLVSKGNYTILISSKPNGIDSVIVNFVIGFVNDLALVTVCQLSKRIKVAGLNHISVEGTNWRFVFEPNLFVVFPVRKSQESLLGL